MPDSPKSATGPLIMERVVQIESTMDDLRQLFEVHTGAAAQHRAMVLKQIEDLHKDTQYYGDQLIKVYHDLNKNLRRLSEQLDRMQQDEGQRAA